MRDAPVDGPAGQLRGILHVYVAFDWGDEIDLARAAADRGQAGQPLPRRRRTPASIEYRPPPVRLSLDPVAIHIPGLDDMQVPAELTLFDFGGVSVALHIPFTLGSAELTQLAGQLADPTALIHTARQAAEPIFQQLQAAIHDAMWSDFSEEFFVFQLPPGEPPPAELLDAQAHWLARLVRLEGGPLSTESTTEALRLHLSYSPQDLFVADWPAALLIDADCEETLQVIEFANLQLLEYRHIDQRLDDAVAVADRKVHGQPGSWLQVWRSHHGPLRWLGELKVEATGLFERTGNVLKLVGDQYLARIYRLLATRFHLRGWEETIQRKLDVLEGIYQVLSDQAATTRAEFLEWTVILLIALEIILALVAH